MSLFDIEVRVVSCGAARSRKEALGVVGCTSCGDCGDPLICISEETVDDPAVVLALRCLCEECDLRWIYQFTAGPGWEDQPEDEQPVFASSERPSTLLSPDYFRRLFEGARARLLNRAPGDHGADFVDAKNALEALSELEKFAAAGVRVGDEAAAQKSWLLERFRSAGGGAA